MKSPENSHWRAAAMVAAMAMAAAAACGGDSSSDSSGGGADTTGSGDSGAGATAGGATGGDSADYLGDGSLGTVEVRPGEAVQIRSLNVITGDSAPLGLTNQGGIELGVADYGTVHGFDVDLGTRLDGLCTADGGQAAAQTVVADSDVVGVVGTSCSAAAVAAAPLITGAGILMIAPSNTSPSLTSDLAGNEGRNHSVGYYRTSHNALYEGESVAEFVYGELGLTTAAAIHDGDPYTQGLASAFARAYEALGGSVTAFSGVNKEDADMVPVLTEIAARSPQALFFPIFQPAGDHIADQVRLVDGLEDTVLLSSAGLLTDGFMELSQSAGMYFSGPDLRFGDNANESTGRTAQEVNAAYLDAYGEAPTAQYWAHSYDAAALMLDAVAAASYVNEEGTLVIDRAGMRQHMDSVSGYRGLIGAISCDEFGDCGSGKVTVIHHVDPDDIEASRQNIVFEFPGDSG